MEINYFDVAVVSILALFSIRGLLRGFVGEIAGLAAIIGGLWLAGRYYPLVAQHLTFLQDSTWRHIAAYVLIFIAVLLAVGILARILGKILAFSFVSWADKIAGFMLGLLKGLVICAILLLVVQKLIGEAAFLQESRVLPYLNAIMDQVRAHLPADVVQRFNI